LCEILRFFQSKASGYAMHLVSRRIMKREVIGAGKRRTRSVDRSGANNTNRSSSKNRQILDGSGDGSDRIGPGPGLHHRRGGGNICELINESFYFLFFISRIWGVYAF
jgi:hypothetical protein